MKISLNVRPFTIPNSVILEVPAGRRQDGIGEPTSLPISEVDPEVLSGLCDEFRASVFERAGKVDPRAF